MLFALNSLSFRCVFARPRTGRAGRKLELQTRAATNVCQNPWNQGALSIQRAAAERIFEIDFSRDVWSDFRVFLFRFSLPGYATRLRGAYDIRPLAIRSLYGAASATTTRVRDNLALITLACKYLREEARIIETVHKCIGNSAKSHRSLEAFCPLISLARACRVSLISPLLIGTSAFRSTYF